MSESRNFRITLYLSHFFADHRSISRIYVTENMKYIRDLENHITKIFELSNPFYLSTNSLHYLPSLEDIRILEKNEIIM